MKDKEEEMKRSIRSGRRRRRKHCMNKMEKTF